MQAVTLRTERLTLSVPTESDIDAIYVACQDPDIQRFTTVPSPYERSDAVGFIGFVADAWEKDIEYTWALRADGVLAGVVGLHRIDDGAAEIGYWMAAESRGRGLLTEGARAVIEWGLSPAGGALARLQWRAIAGHIVSARAARTLGFRYEGLQRRLLPNRDVRADGWVAALLPEDDRTPQPWPVLEG